MAKDLLEGRKGKGSQVMGSPIKTGSSMKGAKTMLPKRPMKGKR